jgi:hypothetical protein
MPISLVKRWYYNKIVLKNYILLKVLVVKVQVIAGDICAIVGLKVLKLVIHLDFENPEALKQLLLMSLQ